MKPKHFKPSPSAESAFARQLRKVARHSGHIVEMHLGGIDTPQGFKRMQAALAEYSEVIGPWAERQAAKMLERSARSNATHFRKKVKNLELEPIRLETLNQVGDVTVALMREQVALIKSLPIRAGIRAQELATEAFFKGSRASEVAAELLDSTKVSESQAMTIARTEVARSNASFTQARATAVGAQGYIWRTTMDGAERDSHRKMNGKYVPYNKEPRLSDGTTGHAGTFPNCRCYQDVQFDEGF